MRILRECTVFEVTILTQEDQVKSHIITFDDCGYDIGDALPIAQEVLNDYYGNRVLITGIKDLEIGFIVLPHEDSNVSPPTP